MTELKKHRGRHKWSVITADGKIMHSPTITGPNVLCMKCGKPKPEVVIPPEPKLE